MRSTIVTVCLILVACSERPSATHAPAEPASVGEPNQPDPWVSSVPPATTGSGGGSSPTPSGSNTFVEPGSYRADMMELTETLEFRKVRTTTLVVTQEGDELMLGTNGDWKFFDALAIRIAADGTRAASMFGVLPKATAITGSDAQRVTGPWSGTCWKTEPDEPTDRMMSVCIGTMQAMGRGILYYENRKIGDDRPGSNSDFALYFDR